MEVAWEGWQQPLVGARMPLHLRTPFTQFSTIAQTADLTELYQDALLLRVRLAGSTTHLQVEVWIQNL